MACNINTITITGKVMRDAEERTFSNGGSIVSFSIGFLESSWWDAKEKKMQYKNGFLDVKKRFGDKGDPKWVLEKVVKGTQVAITGHLGFEEWETKDKERRSKVVLIADKIQFFDASSESSGDHRNQGRSSDRGSSRGNSRGNDRQGNSRNSRDYDAPDPDVDDGGRDNIPF